jgi:hypothetical protein
MKGVVNMGTYSQVGLMMKKELYEELKEKMDQHEWGEGEDLFKEVGLQIYQDTGNVLFYTDYIKWYGSWVEQFEVYLNELDYDGVKHKLIEIIEDGTELVSGDFDENDIQTISEIYIDGIDRLTKVPSDGLFIFIQLDTETYYELEKKRRELNE